jgi:hypothetical protein
MGYINYRSSIFEIPVIIIQIPYNDMTLLNIHIVEYNTEFYWTSKQLSKPISDEELAESNIYFAAL